MAAAPVQISNWSGAMPVSSIRIPSVARPGYYNLAWSIAAGSSWSISGASVVHIE
jgi:hypothetical protein